MRKIAVISVNENPNYLFYLPVVIEGWYKLGYDVCLFMAGKTPTSYATLIRDVVDKFSDEFPNRELNSFASPSIGGIDDTVVTQCIRLFAGYLYEDDVRLITSDVDMLVKKDIFEDRGGIDTYGRDLTDWHYPICYISMTAKKWREAMGIDMKESFEANMERIIKQEPYHESDIDWKRWGTDQEIITKKLESIKGFVYHHDRGVDETTGQPTGRLDRYGWKMPVAEIIDVHLPRDPMNNYDKIAPLCGEWFDSYFNEFKEMYG